MSSFDRGRIYTSSNGGYMITLATLPTATAQEVFNQVKNHLLTQNKKAAIHSLCKYRLLEDREMLKCAAGCLISDEEYNEDMEGKTWNGIENVPRIHSILICDLQYMHDEKEVETWETELRHIAIVNNLVF